MAARQWEEDKIDQLTNDLVVASQRMAEVLDERDRLRLERDLLSGRAHLAEDILSRTQAAIALALGWLDSGEFELVREALEVAHDKLRTRRRRTAESESALD